MNDPSGSDLYKTVSNKNRPAPDYSPASGIRILTVNGQQFKDLAGKMTLEQIGGLRYRLVEPWQASRSAGISAQAQQGPARATT